MEISETVWKKLSKALLKYVIYKIHLEIIFLTDMYK